MKALELTIDWLSIANITDIDQLLLEVDEQPIIAKSWSCWQTCLYDCLVQSKQLYSQIKDPQIPLIWLLPALSFNNELKQMLAASLKQLFATPDEHMLFFGASSMHAAIKLASNKNWQQANIAALDATYRVNAEGAFSYQGTGAALATLTFKNNGWIQQGYGLVPAVDFVTHSPVNGVLSQLLELNSQAIDVIFAPGNGIDTDDWLNYLPLLSRAINEHTHYQLLNYRLGKIGALEGLVNIYHLTSCSEHVMQYQHALMISQEQQNHQAAASYLWISEEIHN
ncbi:hypothetical protein [Pseudoalteromonas mariniglutinosa]|uniref:hypothetical protein n=1 Tax=Pseudoalteromonas mariniglutinosa TaxID=206042 RepID=UPI00384BDCC8